MARVDNDRVAELLRQIQKQPMLSGLMSRVKALAPEREVRLMEVCGTHTMAIHRAGLPTILPSTIRLLSGPGCPVCVTPSSYLDTACAMGRTYDVALTTFGDMTRVPGSTGTLADLRREGRPLNIVYSPLDAVALAAERPDRQVVFLAVGFETTAPAVAAAVIEARRRTLTNFSILAAHKRLIPALRVLASDAALAVDGFILPGHVSTIIGSSPYDFLARTHHRAGVIAGFETADVLQTIILLLAQIRTGRQAIEIQYRRAVREEGNLRARTIMESVFAPVDSEWRGFGIIPESGLALRDEYEDFDAAARFPVTVISSGDPPGCRCGDVLRGTLRPPECPLFGGECRPDHPIGPCMVSAEGTCAAHFVSAGGNRAQ